MVVYGLIISQIVFGILLIRSQEVINVEPDIVALNETFIHELSLENIGDWPRKIAIYELSLVLLYVPWSADCLHARDVYNDASRRYYNKVYFAAINCWKLQNGCHYNFTNSNQWPVLIAYVKGKTPIKFNGLWHQFSVEKFIDGIMLPYHRVHSKYEVLKMTETSIFVVVGYFKDLKSLEYLIFVHAALKWLEVDSEQNVRFALSIGFFNEDNGIDDFPMIKIFDGHTSEIFPTVQQWNVENIIRFVKEKSSPYSYFLQGSHQVKLLPVLLSKGPVLLYSSRSDKQFTHIKTLVSFMRFCRNNQQLSGNYGVLNDTATSSRTTQVTQNRECHEFLKTIGEIKTNHFNFTEFLNLCQFYTSCNYNRTLSILTIHWNVLDEILFQLNENLYYKMANETCALLIDSKKEIVNIIPDYISLNSGTLFMENFSEDHLLPLYKSNINQINVITNSIDVINIDELNREIFLEALSKNVTLVAVIYSSNCALCTLMSNAVLQVSVMIDIPDVKFVRIDSNRNDLPWIYNMENGPTLIVIPRNRPMASKVFPRNMKINIRNIYMFILSQLNSNEQMRIVVNTCTKMDLTKSLKCMRSAERLLYKLINKHLMFWQVYEESRSNILELLKDFKYISTDLMHVY